MYTKPLTTPEDMHLSRLWTSKFLSDPASLPISFRYGERSKGSSVRSKNSSVRVSAACRLAGAPARYSSAASTPTSWRKLLKPAIRRPACGCGWNAWNTAISRWWNGPPG